MSWRRRIKDGVNALADSSSPLVSAIPRLAKALKRTGRRKRHRAKLRAGDVNFVTLDELAVWTRDWIEDLPETYDVVIGVPRSGMLVASILACKLGLPLTTPELYREGRWWSSRLLDSPSPGSITSVLIVNDSIDRGTSMAAARSVVEEAPGRARVTTAALIAHRHEATSIVDLHYRVLEHPSIFEWNLMHAKTMTRLSSSLEGVLDKPGRIPAYEIDVIVAGGCEEDRARTETWLREKGVLYRDLAFLGDTSKAEILTSARPDMHFEGTLAEAQSIWQTTRIPTLSLDAMELVGTLR